MLLSAGLIELAEARGKREKPYRAVAPRVRVAPELVASGAADDARAAMLDDVRRAWQAHTETGEFRSAQLTVKMDPDRIGELWQFLAEKAAELEHGAGQPIQVSIFAYPRPGRDDD